MLFPMIGNELLGISDAQEVTLCSPPKPTSYAWGKWNLEKWRENLKGEGITIAILDTGIYRSHDAFKPDNEFVPKISALSKNFCNGDEDDINDEDGHGTACAGIAAGMPFIGYLGGVAPGAQLIVCKVVVKRDEVKIKIKIKTILKALKYLEEVSKRNTINVVSMSLGFPEADNPTLNQQKNMRDLRTTIKRLQNMGIICVAAAGNGGTHPENHPVFSPAKFDCTIAVGAHDTLWHRYKCSPSSPEVDFTTLGEEVCIPKKDEEKGLGYMSGTSMATPAVAGLIACIVRMQQQYMRKENPDFDFVKGVLKKMIGKNTEEKVLYPYKYFTKYI